MKIGNKIYEFTSKKMKTVAIDSIIQRMWVENTWKNFAKKVGASSTLYVASQGNNKNYLAALTFKEEPDKTLWKPRRNSHGWIPRRDTKLGRMLYSEFTGLPQWDKSELMKACKWEDIFVPGFMYQFSFWYINNGEFSGISVPVFSSETYKHHPDARYKPVPGMREITYGTYERRLHAINNTSSVKPRSRPKSTKRNRKSGI